MSKDALQHIAIIMDGNGRWAKSRGLPRTAGHSKGIDACKRTVRAAAELDIGYLTLFGFSTENWKRPAEEINELMRLLRMYLRSETAELHRNNICLKVIGDLSVFPTETRDLIANAEELTKNNDALTVTIALNYGGRYEIMRAASQMATYFQENGIEPDIANTEEHFERFLFTRDLPDPDILIRTGGEKRISNFLLWQCAYTELFYTETFWPDFGREVLEEAIEEYSRRERRFGAVVEK